MSFEIPPRSGRIAQRPELFLQLHAKFPKQDTALGEALKNCAHAYKSAHETHERLGRDETSTAGAKIVKSARNVRAKLGPAVDALDAALSNSNEAANQLRVKVTQAFRPAAPNFVEYMLGAEIRQQFLKMNNEQIAKTLQAAREAGDLETLQAVASYDAKLANVPAPMQRWVRDELIAIRAPEEQAALTGLGEQIGAAQQFKAEMLSSLSELIDWNRAAEIETAARADMV